MPFNNKVKTPLGKNATTDLKHPAQIPLSDYKTIIQRVRTYPQSFSPADAIVLQRAIGNYAVCQLMKKIGLLSNSSNPIQTKSDKPEQVGALAYAQDTHIPVAPEQEKHSPHVMVHKAFDSNIDSNASQKWMTMQLKKDVLQMQISPKYKKGMLDITMTMTIQDTNARDKKKLIKEKLYFNKGDKVSALLQYIFNTYRLSSDHVYNGYDYQYSDALLKGGFEYTPQFKADGNNKEIMEQELLTSWSNVLRALTSSQEAQSMIVDNIVVSTTNNDVELPAKIFTMDEGKVTLSNIIDKACEASQRSQIGKVTISDAINISSLIQGMSKGYIGAETDLSKNILWKASLGTAANAIKSQAPKFVILNAGGGDGKFHAEQYLILALVHAMKNGYIPSRVNFSGVKPPCNVCSQVLELHRAAFGKTFGFDKFFFRTTDPKIHSRSDVRGAKKVQEEGDYRNMITADGPHKAFIKNIFDLMEKS